MKRSRIAHQDDARERSALAIFDRGLSLRDAHQYDKAIEILLVLSRSLETTEKTPFLRTLHAYTHMQLGSLYKDTHRHDLELEQFRQAVAAAPGLEIASVGLFYSLWSLDRTTEALDEMIRFLERSFSSHYRDRLVQGFGDALSPDDLERVRTARSLLSRFS